VKAKENAAPIRSFRVTTEQRTWFEAEPWSTGSSLLGKLHAEHPAGHPDKRLRTLERRLKSWRSEQATRSCLAPRIRHGELIMKRRHNEANDVRRRPVVTQSDSSATSLLLHSVREQNRRGNYLTFGNIATSGNTFSNPDCRAASAKPVRGSAQSDICACAFR